jgi:peptide/nickel transport system ATP-binding protein
LSFTCKSLKINHEDKKLVDINFSFKKSFALIGESGSGKSLTLRALLGMLPKELSCQLELENIDFKLQKGKTVAIVPQNPFTALSPLTKIKDQFLVPKDEAKQYFEMVGLQESFLQRFPSELSGGQLQRVVIAFILHINPKLLLLDEPTTALDSKSKKSILKLIKELHVKNDFKLMFVTHDIESVENLCEEIAILKDGKIIEYGDMKSVLESPKEKYTKQLIESGFKYRGFRI